MLLRSSLALVALFVLVATAAAQYPAWPQNPGASPFGPGAQGRRDDDKPHWGWDVAKQAGPDAVGALFKGHGSAPPRSNYTPPRADFAPPRYNYIPPRFDTNIPRVKPTTFTNSGKSGGRWLAGIGAAIVGVFGAIFGSRRNGGSPPSGNVIADEQQGARAGK
jgi:hypothetical protein